MAPLSVPGRGRSDAKNELHTFENPGAYERWHPQIYSILRNTFVVYFGSRDSYPSYFRYVRGDAFASRSLSSMLFHEYRYLTNLYAMPSSSSTGTSGFSSAPPTPHALSTIGVITATTPKQNPFHKPCMPMLGGPSAR